ncbi:MAG: LacI family DNA-binding transcriptional regulator, partial [Spirochaetia bacterium]|nr:LacI family DNA-binding transcriptional regulator [Spirochaetia bacterium]
MISMRQVAKKAGVHVSTVSRALSGKVPVDPETAARIKGVVEKFHYEPNFLAKNLALGQSQILGVITHRAIEGNFFWEIFGGIESAASERRYHPLVLTSGDADEAGALIRQKRMDGLIALVSGGEDFAEVLPSGDDLPFVVVNKDLPGKLCVRSDYFSGARELVRSAAGATKPSAFFIGANSKNTTYAELRRGFESAADELKILKIISGNQDGDLETVLEKAVG